MSDSSLDHRVHDFTKRQKSFAAQQNESAAELLNEVAVKIEERLLALFEQRSQDVESLTFEKWLDQQFEYDHFFVFCIFEEDEELKRLVEQSHHLGRRSDVARAVNDLLKNAGHINQFGINRGFVNIAPL